MDSKSDAIVEVTARQLRAARALLGWSRDEAASRCGVGAATLSRLEREVRLSDRLVDAIVAGFQSHGVIFFDDDRGHGVALKDDRSGA